MHQQKKESDVVSEARAILEREQEQHRIKIDKTKSLEKIVEQINSDANGKGNLSKVKRYVLNVYDSIAGTEYTLEQSTDFKELNSQRKSLENQLASGDQLYDKVQRSVDILEERCDEMKLSCTELKDGLKKDLKEYERINQDIETLTEAMEVEEFTAKEKELAVMRKSEYQARQKLLETRLKSQRNMYENHFSLFEALLQQKAEAELDRNYIEVSRSKNEALITMLSVKAERVKHGIGTPYVVSDKLYSKKALDAVDTADQSDAETRKKYKKVKDKMPKDKERFTDVTKRSRESMGDLYE